MAPSPLPTELISHVLELLYDDVRTRDIVDPTELDVWHGVKVPSIFFPILTVSQTFHALALPILYRHLFLVDESASSPGFVSDHELLLSKLQWTCTIRLLNTNDNVDYREMFGRCSSLRSLDISCSSRFHPLFDFVIFYLPSTLFALTLGTTSVTYARSDLATLSTSLPNLKTLDLAIEWVAEMDALPPSVWKLEYLHCLRVRGAASPLVQWLNEAKETLRTLVIVDLALITDSYMIWLDEHVLQGLSAPMTALRYLDTSNFKSDIDLISAERFPSLTHLYVSVDAATLRSILTTATTLEIADISLGDLDLSDQSIIAVIVEFLTGRPAMRLFVLNVDYGEHDAQVNVVSDGWWGKPIVELCDERGILFCCDHGGAFGEDWEAEAEWVPGNDKEEDSQSSIGSSGIEDADDFDAEDEELWAQHWTEEERVALEIVAPLDSESVASAQARPLRRSARLQS